MTFLKKCSLAVLLAISIGIFPIAKLKADENGTAFDSRTFADLIIINIKAASTAIDADSKCEEVAHLIKAALDVCKEMDASDWVDKDRMKACFVLKSAKKHAKECRFVNAKNELTQAKNMIEAIRIRYLNFQKN